MSLPTIRLRFSPDTPKLRARISPAVPPKQTYFRNDGISIQWKSGSTGDWQDLVPLDTITGPVADVVAGAGIAVSASVSHPVVSIADGDNGDIVVSGSGTAWTIASSTLSTFMRTVLVAASAAASWLLLLVLGHLTSRTLVKALVPATGMAVFLSEAGREGSFVWRSGDYSTQVAADTAEGVFLKADTISAAAGAWVRAYSGPLDVHWFGAKGHGAQVAVTATIGSGSHSLTATGAAFTAANVGDLILVQGAGTAGGRLYTTISAVTDATHVTLTAAAITAVSASAITLWYGNDDTAAIQAAINLAFALGGGAVNLGAGVFGATSQIVFKNGVSVYGYAGAPAFIEYSLTGVCALLWLTTDEPYSIVDIPALWVGRFDGVVIDGLFVADRCLRIKSVTGCMFSNLYLYRGAVANLDLDTDGSHTLSLNTFINVMCENAAVIAAKLHGTVTSPVTLNNFQGCRFGFGSTAALNLSEYADTNQFYGGRIEANSGKPAIMINNVSGSVSSVLFSGVTIEGNGSAMCSIAAEDPLLGGDDSHVALFDGCHITGFATFNSSSGVVKARDCSGVGYLFSGTGDWGAVTTPTVSTSPHTYTNTNPFAVQAVVTGGTVSSIGFKRSGTTTTVGFTSGSMMLEPGDALVITHTGAPTLKVFPH